jgi:hypothetical protein
MKTSLMHYLSSVYFVNQPLHVSGISVAHQQEVYCTYISICIYNSQLKSKIRTNFCIYNNWYVLCFLADCLLSEFHLNSDNRQSTKKHNTYQLLYIYNIHSDEGLQVCSKHVVVDWRNKLRTKRASSRFSLHGCIEMHGQKKIIYCIRIYFGHLIRVSYYLVFRF